MRITVVGASGNLGTALLRRLAADGEHEVVGVCRRIPPQRSPYDQASWHSVDVAGVAAADQLSEVFAGSDAVVNLAWGFQPTRNTAQLERVGVGGLLAVCRAVVACGVPHLVHMSSVGAYSPGRAGQRVDESWPTAGIPTSVYSRHKAQAERELDELGREQGERLTITRFRPGLVMQQQAGSALLRYGLPGYLPAGALRLLPLLPLDRSFTIPVVHADDVAEAVVSAIAGTVGGPFNLAADPPIDRSDLADALGAWPVQFPTGALRMIVDLTWRARLQRIDAGWLDLAFGVPLLDTGRAAQLLGWTPKVDARAALRAALAGMISRDSTGSPVLRTRTVRGELADRLRLGPITQRAVS